MPVGVAYHATQMDSINRKSIEKEEGYNHEINGNHSRI